MSRLHQAGAVLRLVRGKTRSVAPFTFGTTLRRLRRANLLTRVLGLPTIHRFANDRHAELRAGLPLDFEITCKTYTRNHLHRATCVIAQEDR